MSRNENEQSEIIHAFREKSARARADAEARRAEVDAKFPEIARIDETLQATGLRILLAATKGEGDIKKRIAQLKETNDELLAARGEILRSNGYPEDYSDVHYECEKCSDSGFLPDGKCATALKELLRAPVLNVAE